MGGRDVQDGWALRYTRPQPSKTEKRDVQRANTYTRIVLPASLTVKITEGPPACNVEEVRGDEFQRVSHSLRILFHGFRLHSDVARLTLGSVAHTVLHTRAVHMILAPGNAMPVHNAINGCGTYHHHHHHRASHSYVALL